MPWLRLYSLLAAAWVKNGETVYVCVGPVSDAVPRSQTARRTAPADRKDGWRFWASVRKTLAKRRLHLAACAKEAAKH